MNTPSDDKLDHAFSAFLKTEMNRHPWPTAPQPLAASRGQERRPSDSTAHSRLVLAASVAIFLGGCWVLSNGFEAPDRGPATPAGTNLLPGSTANEKGVLPAIRKEKAKDDPMGGPINLP